MCARVPWQRLLTSLVTLHRTEMPILIVGSKTDKPEAMGVNEYDVRQALDVDRVGADTERAMGLLGARSLLQVQECDIDMWPWLVLAVVGVGLIPSHGCGAVGVGESGQGGHDQREQARQVRGR